MEYTTYTPHTIYGDLHTEYHIYFWEHIPLSLSLSSLWFAQWIILLHAHQPQANHHRSKISSTMESMRQQCHWPHYPKQPTLSSCCAYDDALFIPHKCLVTHRRFGGLRNAPRWASSRPNYPWRAAIGGGSQCRHLGKETICFPNCREAPCSFGLREGGS